MPIKKSVTLKKYRRAGNIAAFLLVISIGIGLILKVFNDNIVFFFSPTDIISKHIQASEKIIRVGGLVKAGSIENRDDGAVNFIVTDGTNELPIIYQGILPSLFREGQGTVATGYLRIGYFEAKELLAKHDENYMPKEVAETLKRSGYWRAEK